MGQRVTVLCAGLVLTLIGWSLAQTPDAPSVKIIEPPDGSKLWGRATIRLEYERSKVSASPIKRIDFEIDGKQYGSDASKFQEQGRLEYDFPTGGVPNGKHQLTVTITDEAGKGAKQTLSITIEN